MTMPHPGQECTINNFGDLFMLEEARPFIGASCIVIKKTKSGLIQVALKNFPKKTLSVPLRNVDLDNDA